MQTDTDSNTENAERRCCCYSW